MRKLTSNDKTWGPFTWVPWSKTLSVTLSSAGDDEDEPDEKGNIIRVIGFGWVIQMALPEIIQPFRVKHVAHSWDAETIARLGRDWYYETHERVFGFSLSDMGNGYDFLQIFHGARTHSSDTDQTWSKHLPWKQWSHVRTSLYNPDGSLFATEDRSAGFRDWFRIKEECPATHFGFEDYDGEMIVATCRIDEMEWHKGAGWFKWLKYFAKPKIRRSLEIAFSAEVGPEKGSWKGGTTGHGIEMLTGETPEAAFRRYCDKEHERKGRRCRLRFIGPCNPPTKQTKDEDTADSLAGTDKRSEA